MKINLTRLLYRIAPSIKTEGTAAHFYNFDIFGKGTSVDMAYSFELPESEFGDTSMNRDDQ